MSPLPCSDGQEQGTHILYCRAGPCLPWGHSVALSCRSQDWFCSILGRRAGRGVYGFSPSLLKLGGANALKHPSLDLIPSTELLPRGEELAQWGHRNNDSHNVEIFLI